MTKARITDIAMHNASNLDGRDVATVSRNKTCVTLRHVWPENTDGRVWDGVSKAAHRLAQELANKHGHDVAIFAKSGDEIDEIQPQD